MDLRLTVFLPLPRFLVFIFNFSAVAHSATLMATDQITALAPPERGAGGKLRNLPPRKPPPSPYARPPEATRRRWISKLVDPAYRLITGGATRILPSFFSATAAAPPPSLLPCPTSAAEDQGHILFFSFDFSRLMLLPCFVVYDFSVAWLNSGMICFC